MEVSAAEEILERINRKIEELKRSRDVFSAWRVSVQDRGHVLLGHTTLKAYLKHHLGLKYLSSQVEEYATTIEIVINTAAQIEVKLANDCLFVGGRYRKNVRGISNTPMSFASGKRRGPVKRRLPSPSSAVEECEPVNIRVLAVSDWAEPIRSYFRGEKAVFMSSGREDIDVRMLGAGRPFLLRIEDPKSNLPKRLGTILTVTDEKNQEVAEYGAGYHEIVISHCLPATVELLDTRLVRKEVASQQLKAIEETKRKNYQVRVFAKKTSKQIRDRLTAAEWKEEGGVYTKEEIELDQKTPIRVLHRRANLTRARKLYGCQLVVSSGETEEVVGCMLQVNLVADAGAYIKEFINGDFGRTAPSLSEMLGVFCDVVELDVTGIEADFPTAAMTIARLRLEGPPAAGTGLEIIGNIDIA